jgi:hypothetical protein
MGVFIGLKEQQKPYEAVDEIYQGVIIMNLMHLRKDDQFRVKWNST